MFACGRANALIGTRALLAAQTAYLAQRSTTHRALLAPVRDTVFDHAWFLQKVIRLSSPGEILEPFDEIEETETACGS